MTEISRRLGRRATLDDVPDADLDRWRDLGFDWVWFLSVWRTGPKSRQVSLSEPGWRREFQETLPDLTEEDIGGSGFAIAEYTVSPDLGGNEALARLRSRLTDRGLKLMLDFVPNHLGLDHPWVEDHPDYFVSGSPEDLARQPQNYTRVSGGAGDRIMAYGRDPYFAGWPDTLQLNYANPNTQDALIGELRRIAGQCDGLRCDMAMLALPEVFEKTWGRRSPPFWQKAIQTIRAQHSAFCFMAEVYWDMEWTLMQQGFDYAYDKKLYDRLRHGHARPVREHLMAEIGYQNKLARFLENHDECRAAATFEPGRHEAAAVITFCGPGLRFFHQGQLEGKTKRISPHLVRGPRESLNESLNRFYQRLLDVLRSPTLREGQWWLLDCQPAWEGNPTADAFLAFGWRGAEGQKMLVAVNDAPHFSQCYVPWDGWQGTGLQIRLIDRMSDAVYDRPGSDLRSRGLYLDLPPWGFHIFDVLAHATKVNS